MSQEAITINDVFRHFKGDLYIVVGLSIAVETGVEIPRVEFRRVVGDGTIYSRTLSNFLEFVDRPDYGYYGPRFAFREASMGS